MSSFRAAPGADLGGQDSGQEGGSVAEDRHPTKVGSLIDKVWYLPNLR